MISLAGLALGLGVLSCTADTVTYWPTTTILWTHDGVNTAGYRVYWRHADRTDNGWDGSFDISMQTIDDEAGGPPLKFASGWSIDLPLQRHIVGESIEIVYMVKAFTAANVESVPSNFVTICLPKLWQPGEVYE